MYDHIICGCSSVISNWSAAVSVPVFGSRYMYMHFEKVNVVFLYIMHHLDTFRTS